MSLNQILKHAVLSVAVFSQSAVLNAAGPLDEAQNHYQRGAFPECIDLTTRVLLENPKNHRALYLRASAHVELGVVRRDGKELRLGIEDARESLRAGGVDEVDYYLPYMYGMTTLAELEGRNEHAEVVVQIGQTVLGRTNLTSEQRSNLHDQRAKAFVYLKNLDAAIQNYQSAIRESPRNLGSHVGLAECYANAGQSDKALLAFSSAVEAFPDNSLVYNNRGLFQQKSGRLREAVEDFNRAVEIDPKFAVAYANRGFAYERLHQFGTAIEDYSEAIRLDGMHPLFRSLRGTCRLSMLDCERAVQDYSAAIELEPTNPLHWANLGFARYFAHDYGSARIAFDRAVNMNAGMRYLNPWRCWVRVMDGDTNSLQPILDLTLSRDTPQRDWIDQLVLFINGKISEQQLVRFVDSSRDANVRNAELAEAYFFIAERRIQAGDNDNGKAFHSHVIRTNCTDLSAFRGAQFVLQHSLSPKSMPNYATNEEFFVVMLADAPGYELYLSRSLADKLQGLVNSDVALSVAMTSLEVAFSAASTAAGIDGIGSDAAASLITALIERNAIEFRRQLNANMGRRGVVLTFKENNSVVLGANFLAEKLRSNTDQLLINAGFEDAVTKMRAFRIKVREFTWAGETPIGSLVDTSTWSIRPRN